MNSFSHFNQNRIIMASLLKRKISRSSFKYYSQSSNNGDGINKNEKPISKIPEDKRPLWYIFPGMGTQWSGMGQEMMKIPPFKESIEKSTKTLSNAGVDLKKLLAPGNQSIFKNIRDAFNSIASIQIALYDTLTAAGINPRPKGFFGHSAGEILCAYCDGSITAEEAIRNADARGKSILEVQDPNKPGAMAAVFASWDEVKARLPRYVTAACHNGPKSVTISGPRSAIQSFLKELKQANIQAIEVNSCGIAAHSPAIEAAKPIYIKYLEEIYGESILRYRLDRWIPTSFPKSQRNCVLSKTASPEFYGNNLVQPVLFHQAVIEIPKEAVVVEIAPKGLFQGIIKASVPKSVNVFAPMEEGGSDKDKLKHFINTLKEIGKTGIYVDKNVVGKWSKLAGIF